MLEGTILQWLKAVGDTVTKGEPIAEAEAEKTNFEIPAPVSGVLSSIVVPEGEQVRVRTVIATISDPGDADVPCASSMTRDKPAAAPPASVPDFVEVVPAARRLAQVNRIDLAAIRGTGPRGRITEADVNSAIELRGDSAVDSAQNTRVVPLRGARGRLAERLHASLQSMAQLTLMTEADVTDLVAERDAAKREIPVTYTHLLIRACALALREHPRLNAAVEDNEIRERRDINIGIAVPLPDGLIVPVIRSVDQMTLAEIVQSSDAAVAQAKAGKATPALVAGGTFTISNLGTFGIDSFTPIINPPEVAILGAGRIAAQLVPSDDSSIVWRKFIRLSLTIDHRAVDGVPGAQFLQTLTGLLQSPTSLFT